jgi:hypothetical protein
LISNQRGWKTSQSDRDQQTTNEDSTVEEIRLFVRRLKKRWPDLCIDCKSVIRETLS